MQTHKKEIGRQLAEILAARRKAPSQASPDNPDQALAEQQQAAKSR